MLIEKVYDELNEQIQDLKKTVAALGSGGTTDYSELTNKPSINGITLSGYKYSDDLKIAKSMTETQYTTAQKYSQTLYCLTENEPESHTQETVPATNFTWTADGDNWVSDEYSIHEENATSITVTTTTEGITLSVTGSGEDRTVILTSSVDPETLTNIVIQIDTVNDVGTTRIVKDGVEFGKSSDGYLETVLFDSTTSQAGTLSDDYDNYDQLVIYAKSTNTSGDYQTTRTVLTSEITSSAIYSISTDSWYSSTQFGTHTTFTSPVNSAANITKIVGIKY